MALYTYTEHSITDAKLLHAKLVFAGDLIPEFAINTDIYIFSELPKATIDQVIVYAGD